MHTLHILAGMLLAVPALSQSAVWGQCGGIGFTGATSCVTGTACIKLNDYYSQCQPSSASSSSATTSAPAATTSAPAATTTAATSACPALPSNPALTSNAKLPDPFQPLTGSRITAKSAWPCRAAELSALLQKYELGTLPPAPSSVTASFSGSTLSITVTDSGKSISFSVSVSRPSGTGPFPALIAFGGLSIPAPSGVAVLTFNNDDIAAQVNTGSRGAGKFYTLYGASHPAGAMMAWAWGVARIVDALELTAAATGIDATRVGVTGCSRNGKGALVAGAFEPRLALTIAQESGAGGSACWRVSDAMKAAGKNVQTATQIVTENVWFAKAFEAYVAGVAALPFDHHELAALIAPRGLLVIENTGQEWLGAESTFVCMRTAQMVWEALGAKDAMGFSQVGGHGHCVFPSAQQPELSAFVDRFLKGLTGVNTAVMKTDGGFVLDEAKWLGWGVPVLT
ncbi:carbohydrate esterase family 15 protein [Geopyxis carbonaria]|nr:carbohydrate esterase family 15 protein [Geopyxis carbonaria]